MMYSVFGLSGVDGLRPDIVLTCTGTNFPFTWCAGVFMGVPIHLYSVTEVSLRILLTSSGVRSENVIVLFVVNHSHSRRSRVFGSKIWAFSCFIGLLTVTMILLVFTGIFVAPSGILLDIMENGSHSAFGSDAITGFTVSGAVGVSWLQLIRLIASNVKMIMCVSFFMLMLLLPDFFVIQ